MGTCVSSCLSCKSEEDVNVTTANDDATMNNTNNNSHTHINVSPRRRRRDEKTHNVSPKSHGRHKNAAHRLKEYKTAFAEE